MKSRGFTLVELMITVSIVGILIGLIVSVINPAKMYARARDSTRLKDIAALMNAVERYNIDFGFYPDDVGVVRYSNVLPVGNNGPLQSASEGWIKAPLSSTVSVLPTDPLNEGDFVYVYTHSETAFELNFDMEYYTEREQNDGGNNSEKLEVGNDMTLLP